MLIPLHTCSVLVLTLGESICLYNFDLNGTMLMMRSIPQNINNTPLVCGFLCEIHTELRNKLTSEKKVDYSMYLYILQRIVVSNMFHS